MPKSSNSIISNCHAEGSVNLQKALRVPSNQRVKANANLYIDKKSFKKDKYIFIFIFIISV